MVVRVKPTNPNHLHLCSQVESQEAVAQEKAAATKAIADDAQRDLDEALPALDVAVACLKDLKKSDIDEVNWRFSFRLALPLTCREGRGIATCGSIVAIPISIVAIPIIRLKKIANIGNLFWRYDIFGNSYTQRR